MSQITKEVLIAKADGNTDRNIKANITLRSSLAFISLSQSAGPGVNTTDKSAVADVTYNCSVLSSSIVKRQPSNILVDKDIPDRYTFIAILASYLQSSELDVYYDTIDKNLFCIPSLIDIGDTDKTKDAIKNITLDIEGYGLGVKANGGNINRNCISPFEDLKLETVNPIDTKLHLLRIPGKPSTSANNQTIALGNNVGIENMNSVPSQFVSLGSTADLGVKVPAFRYVRTSINNYSLIFMGTLDLDDVLVVLPL